MKKGTSSRMMLLLFFIIISVIVLWFGGLGYFLSIVAVTHWLAGLIFTNLPILRKRNVDIQNYSVHIRITWLLIGVAWVAIALFSLFFANFPLYKILKMKLY